MPDQRRISERSLNPQEDDPLDALVGAIVHLHGKLFTGERGERLAADMLEQRVDFGGLFLIRLHRTRRLSALSFALHEPENIDRVPVALGASDRLAQFINDSLPRGTGQKNAEVFSRGEGRTSRRREREDQRTKSNEETRSGHAR